MTNMVTKLGNDLLVCSPEGYAMITICTLSRARARLSKGSKIRRPVRQKIEITISAITGIYPGFMGRR